MNGDESTREMKIMQLQLISFKHKATPTDCMYANISIGYKVTFVSYNLKYGMHQSYS